MFRYLIEQLTAISVAVGARIAKINDLYFLVNRFCHSAELLLVLLFVITKSEYVICFYRIYGYVNKLANALWSIVAIVKYNRFLVLLPTLLQSVWDVNTKLSLSLMANKFAQCSVFCDASPA